MRQTYKLEMLTVKKQRISIGHQQSPEKSCGFQMEKPKLSKFLGDVREYVIFRVKFTHTLESTQGDNTVTYLLKINL